jgi:hypothetical protein
VRRPSARGELWHRHADWLIVCPLFLALFILSLKVTGWL